MVDESTRGSAIGLGSQLVRVTGGLSPALGTESLPW